MAETFVQLNTPSTAGAKVKTYESTDTNGDTVESQAVTLTDELGNEIDAGNPLPVAVASNSGTLSNGTEVVVDATSGGVLILAANPSRKSAVVTNTGDGAIRVGVAGVTATSGIPLAPGDSVVFEMPFCVVAAIHAIRSTSTSSTVAVVEVA